MLKYIEKLKFNQAGICKSEYPWYADFIKRNGIKKIIEFGPGISTWAFLENPDVEIICYEPNMAWYRAARNEFSDFFNVKIRSFDEFVIEEADFVHVDSPPGKATLSRLDACKNAMECSNLFILHDAKRKGEQETAEYIQGCGWNYELITSNRGIGIFSKDREYEVGINGI